MTTTPVPFEWRVVETQDWPPRRRPRPPLGPTQIDVARSCSLRSCFEYSPGYERRMAFEGRIGAAFHTVLESLSIDPIVGNTPDGIATVVRQRFTQALQHQITEANQRPRELGLPRASHRADLAVMALIEAAQRTGRSLDPVSVRSPSAVAARAGATTAAPNTQQQGMPEMAVELPIASRDGLFRGRIDRVERTESGIRITDYKSSVRDELPERYARQVQLYAALWFDVYGVWPAEGEVVYPLVARSYTIPVEPTVCQVVREEAAAVIVRLQDEPDPARLAQPGEVCRICEFRPWCRPFWQWQSVEPKRSLALERAAWGFEGSIEMLSVVSQHWKLKIRWQDALVDLVAPAERFPQLEKASIGTHIRVLDAQLQGLRHQPRAVIAPTTEIWLCEV